MKSHPIRQILAQVPGSYPVVVRQNGADIEITDVSFSHQPPQVLITLAPAKADENKDHLAGFAVWWHNEGSAMAPRATEDLETFAKRIAEIAWSNGRYIRENNIVVPPLPEPEATIEELNAIAQEQAAPANFDGTPVPPAGPSENPAVMAKSIAEDAVLPVVGELDAGEVQHQRVHPEEVTTPAKRTRKAKPTETPNA